MPLDLEAIEARVMGTTEGPWDEDGRRFARGVVFVCPRPQDGGVFECAANRRFIAHARADVPALVARVRELEAALAEIVDECSDPLAWRIAHDVPAPEGGA